MVPLSPGLTSLSVAIRLATKKSVRSCHAFRFTELTATVGSSCSAAAQTDVHLPLKTFADQALQVDFSSSEYQVI